MDERGATTIEDDGSNPPPVDSPEVVRLLDDLRDLARKTLTLTYPDDEHGRAHHGSILAQIPQMIDWRNAPRLRPPISVMDVFEERIMRLHPGFYDPTTGFCLDADLPQGSHALQAAAYALAKGWDDEVVVASFMHDFGKFINRRKHTHFGAELIKPYVSERTYAMALYHYDSLLVPPNGRAQSWPGGPDLKDLTWIDACNFEERANRCDLERIAHKIRTSPYYDGIMCVREADDNGRVLKFWPDVRKDVEAALGRVFKLSKEGLGWDDSSAAPLWSIIIERCWMT